jgi:hypothetical protein
MDTKLVYVSKGNCVVKNESNGEFISAVPNVIVNSGDYVSIEGIAVSTNGNGGEIVEVPKQIKNYNYITNEMMIEFMVYIHANFQYTCMLPIKLNPGAGGNSQAIYTTQTDLNYGDLNPSLYTITHNADYIPKNSFLTQKYGGTRLYIGTFGDEGQDVFDTMKSTTINDPNLGTGNKVFNFLKTQIPFKVPYGYNSPSEIASKITFDLHSAMKIPNKNNRHATPENQVEPNLSNANNANEIALQTIATERNASVITINGILNQYYGKTADSSNPYFYGNNSNWICVKNPFYWYWGSRLQAKLPNGTFKNNIWAIANLAGAITQGDILNLNELPSSTTGYVDIARGDVMCLNIPYTKENLHKLQQFIHAEKIYSGTDKTNAEMKADKGAFFTYITIGKYDDGNIAPADNQAKLESKVLTLADTAKCTELPTSTYYAESYWVAQRIRTDISVPFPGRIKTEKVLNIDGVDMYPKQIAQYYDINVVCVELTTGLIKEDCIGILLTTYTEPGNIIKGGNFCLFDSTFTRERSQSAIICSPDYTDGGNVNHLPDLVKGLNVGAPNVNLSFNQDRGRFGWRNMYWSNYVGNVWGATTANPNADLEVITSNKITSGLFVPSIQQVIWEKYAQSGLGIFNIYVKDLTGTFQLIDKDNVEDIEKKYTNSLLDRIGFEYGDLIDTYGLSNVFYQERSVGDNLPTRFPQYYPYPLTNSPYVDTAINQSINGTNIGQGVVAPTFNLSMQRNIGNIQIASQTSEILGTNRPQKLASPYWLIESDIIPAIKYYVDGEPINILGICNRAYSNGDIVYSFSSDYKFMTTKSFTITSIKSNILTSDLLPADVDDSTTIIYKIESQILPNVITEFQTREMEEQMNQKKKK